MKKPSPKAVLTAMSTKLKKLAREGDPIALHAYTGTTKFRDDLMELAPGRLQTVLRLVAKAVVACDAKAPVPAPWSVKRARWDDDMVAKFRAAYTKAGTDEGAARLCGITKGAAMIARKRYVEPFVAHETRIAA